MISATVSGNLGKDAVTRSAGSSTVTGFGVASSRKVKGEKVTQWVQVSCWGKRGEALCKYLTKGTRVAVSGELSTREYEGKTYLEMEAFGIDLLGGGERDGQRGGAGTHRDAPAPTGGGYDDGDANPLGADDDIGF